MSQTLAPEPMRQVFGIEEFRRSAGSLPCETGQPSGRFGTEEIAHPQHESRRRITPGENR